MKIGSCLMIGLKGLSLSPEEKDFIISKGISGLILFKRNIESFRQVHHLCSEIKSLASPPPLIAIDMEGGRVNRFSHLKESPLWPAPEALSQLKPSQVFEMARLMGRELQLLGIDINFAPVIDLPVVKSSPLLSPLLKLTASSSQSSSSVKSSPLLSSLLKGRLFGLSPQEVKKLAGAFVDGLMEENIIPCLKHFPGHGGVKEDSHETLPEDLRSLEELSPQLDLFQSLFNQHPDCWIMTAHIVFSNIERERQRQRRGQEGGKEEVNEADIEDLYRQRGRQEGGKKEDSSYLSHQLNDRAKEEGRGLSSRFRSQDASPQQDKERKGAEKKALLPASFSPFLLKEILRDKMGFKGLLVSDDANMGALKAFAPPDRFFKALKGGCDLLIYGQDLENSKKLVQGLEQQPTKVEEIEQELKVSGRKLFSLREKRSFPPVSFSSVEGELQALFPAFTSLENSWS